jgi:sugar phosphate isomerase/epimerase
MRYGICTGPENLEIVARAGFDYVEFTLNQVAGWTDAAYKAVREQVQAAGIRVEACNGFFPWAMRVVGPEADRQAIADYVKLALPRAAELGVQTTVVGNGGSRRIPDNMSREAGEAAFVEILRLIGDEAAQVGITAAIEPLNSQESNFILSIPEGARVASMAGHPNVKLLADFHHMRMDGEPMSALESARGLLRHVHIANSHGRVYPMDRTEDDYAAFFGMLRRIGYDGRVSIEAGTQDMAADAPRALAMMKTVAQGED